MAEVVNKLVTNKNSGIIKLRASLLEEYLKRYDIAKDVFRDEMVSTAHDKIILKKYYDSQYECAITLVIDDEVVGITFDNLQTIEKVLVKTN